MNKFLYKICDYIKKIKKLYIYIIVQYINYLNNYQVSYI